MSMLGKEPDVRSEVKPDNGLSLTESTCHESELSRARSGRGRMKVTVKQILDASLAPRQGDQLIINNNEVYIVRHLTTCSA